MSEPSFVEASSAIAAILATLAAIFSGWCAFLSYRLSSKLRDEMKSDERIIISKIIHPDLAHHDHKKCVIKCNIFNKSKRKVFVSKVQAYDSKNKSRYRSLRSTAEGLNRRENPCELIGIVDTEELFVRQNVGKEIDFCRLELFHSFSSHPIIAVFDPASEFIG